MYLKDSFILGDDTKEIKNWYDAVGEDNKKQTWIVRNGFEYTSMPDTANDNVTTRIVIK